MSWWTTAIFDTCSLITMDKLLQADPSIARFFPEKLLAIEASLSADQMYEQTARRMMAMVTFRNPPPSSQLRMLLSAAGLSKALSEVDRLLYATAVHGELSVVTGDRRLAKAVHQRGLPVGNMAMILKELVQSGQLTPPGVETLLHRLADQNDLILGFPRPTWEDLRN